MSGEEWEWDGTCSACGVEVEWRNDDGPAEEAEALCHDCAYEALDNTIAALRADLAAKTADLAQASVLLRASEARHEREHAADVEALRVLEATCTGPIRGVR